MTSTSTVTIATSKSTRRIHDGWTVQVVDGPAPAQVTGRAIAASVPGSIHTDLLGPLGAPDLPRPRITHIPLEQASAAHTAMEARSHIGKFVLTTSFGGQL